MAPVDDSEEYTVDGKAMRLSKAQRTLHIQKGLAADKRFKEAADLRAQLNDFTAEFEADPEEALRKIGKDPNKVFASYLEKRAKLELMTQEQRDAEALRARAAAAEAKAKTYEEEKKAAQRAEMDRRNFKALEEQLISAADRNQLDASPETLAGLCDIALEFIEHEVPITADQVAAEYARREREHLEQKDKKLHSVLKGPKLLAYLGADTLKEVRAALAAADAESLKQLPHPQAKPKVAVRAHERTVKGPHISENEFDKKFKL